MITKEYRGGGRRSNEFFLRKIQIMTKVYLVKSENPLSAFCKPHLYIFFQIIYPYLFVCKNT